MREHNAICDHLHERAPRALRRRALRQGAARRRGADGEDPHGRVDAGDHRPPDDGARRSHATGGASRASGSTSCSAGCTKNEVAARHPRLADEPPRRAVLADRGVRRGLPHAPADPRRLHLPLARRRHGAAASARSRSSAPCTCASGWPRSAMDDLFYSFGTVAPRRDHAAQLPAVPAALRAARRRRCSTSPRSTSCAPASAACRATTSSAGSST